MKVRRVKDPTRNGRACFQYGHNGRVFCGRGSRQLALQHGLKTAKEKVKESG